MVRNQSAARSISTNVAAGATGAVAMVMFLAFVVFKESRMSQPTLPLAKDGAEKELVTASAHSPLLAVCLE